MRAARRTWIAVAVLPLLGVTACGSDDADTVRPFRGFDLVTGSSRVMHAYGQTSQPFEQVTRVPAGTRTLAIRFYCRHPSGQTTITAGALGGGSATCGRRGDTGTVWMGEYRPLARTRTVTVTVQAPEGAHWSAAVDAVPAGVSISSEVPS